MMLGGCGRAAAVHLQLFGAQLVPTALASVDSIIGVVVFFSFTRPQVWRGCIRRPVVAVWSFFLSAKNNYPQK